MSNDGNELISELDLVSDSSANLIVSHELTQT